MKKLLRLFFVVMTLGILLCTTALLVTGCREDNEPGNATEEVEDAAEDAAEETKEATEEAGKELQDAGENIEDQM